MFDRLQRWIAAKLADVPARLDELEAEFETIRQEWVDFADIQARREERQKKRDLRRAKELASADDGEEREVAAPREQPELEHNGRASKAEMYRQFFSRQAGR